MLKCWLQTVIKAETYFKSVKRRNDSASQKPAEESNEFQRCLAASVFPKRRVCWETSVSVSVNNRCCFLQTQGLVPRLANERAAPSTIRRRNRPFLSLTHHEQPASGLILIHPQDLEVVKKDWTLFKDQFTHK